MYMGRMDVIENLVIFITILSKVELVNIHD